MLLLALKNQCLYGIFTKKQIRFYCFLGDKRSIKNELGKI